MTDTHPDIQFKYDAMMAALSHGERAEMGCAMHDFSKQIALSQLCSPGKPPAEVMGDLFTRFYREDFSEAAFEKIFSAIRQYHLRKPVEA